MTYPPIVYTMVQYIEQNQEEFLEWADKHDMNHTNTDISLFEFMKELYE